jgi:hypothetical protein
MHLRVRVKWIAIGGLVLGSGGSATAQQAQPVAVPPAAAGEAQVGFERRPQLSPQEELAQAETVLARVDAAAGTVRRQLEAARAARDVVKTLCLNDKLSQVDVANRSARDRQSALQSAVQRNDSELANHEFTIMTVLRQRVEQLTAEANQCIGEELAFVGQTQVTMSQESNLPEDTTDPPPDTTLISEPPYTQSESVGP